MPVYPQFGTGLQAGALKYLPPEGKRKGEYAVIARIGVELTR